MLLTQAMLRLSASMTAARRSSPDWTHTRGISGPIERTLSVSRASIARNTEERMASNARIISPNTSGIIITSAKANRSYTQMATSGVQRKSVLTQNLLPYPFGSKVSSPPRRNGSITCELCTTNPNSPAHRLAATASMEKDTFDQRTSGSIYAKPMARMALLIRVSRRT